MLIGCSGKHYTLLLNVRQTYNNYLQKSTSSSSIQMLQELKLLERLANNAGSLVLSVVLVLFLNS